MADEFLRTAYFFPDKTRGTDTKELHLKLTLGTCLCMAALHIFLNFLCNLNVCGLVHYNS